MIYEYLREHKQNTLCCCAEVKYSSNKHIRKVALEGKRESRAKILCLIFECKKKIPK